MLGSLEGAEKFICYFNLSFFSSLLMDTRDGQDGLSAAESRMRENCQWAVKKDILFLLKYFYTAGVPDG